MNNRGNQLLISVKYPHSVGGYTDMRQVLRVFYEKEPAMGVERRIILDALVYAIKWAEKKHPYWNDPEEYIEEEMEYATDMYTPALIEELHKRYWERFKKKLLTKVSKHELLFPRTTTTTDLIKEFLARGFMHETDVKLNKQTRYCIKCNIADLWWPEDFELHQHALIKMQKIGIPGYTGSTFPKEK